MKLEGKSLGIKQNQIKKLKELFPEVFCEEKIDWEKLKATLGEDISFDNERYVLNWAGKSEAFRVLQEATTATLIPSKEESVNFEDTNHLFIEGENLEVLKVLQKSYYGKVKMIYIDPPYNTGNDSFVYPDRFAEKKDDYLKRVGDKDEAGYMTREGLFRKNSKESGHYHSNWLNMMYPRLFLARNLLKEDGVIFVSIDDNEVHNLRLILNEIFGEENFISTIIWERSFSPVNLKKHFSESHDYILCYSKNGSNVTSNFLSRSYESDKRYSNPDNDPRGPWTSSDMTVGPVVPQKVYDIVTPTGRKIRPTNGRCWLYTPLKYEEMKRDNRIWFGITGNNTPRVKKFLSEVKEGITPMTIWKHSEVGHTQDAAQRLKELFDGKDFFDYPKSVPLIGRMLELYTEKESIVLDFFAGSGTTAQAVLDLNKDDKSNRKFICVQMPEKTDEDSEAYKAGYKTISDIAKERIRRAIKKIKADQDDKKDLITEMEENKLLDLGFKVFKLQPSNFKIWRGSKFENDEELIIQLDAFTDPVKQDAEEENILYELLLKMGYDLNSKIEKIDDLFIIKDGEIVLALTKINEEIINKIISLNPQKCLALDRLFHNNDQLKTNTVLQMKDENIEFRTI